jgi:hypothetical protein
MNSKLRYLYSIRGFHNEFIGCVALSVMTLYRGMPWSTEAAGSLENVDSEVHDPKHRYTGDRLQK